jgi:hypothetical protein
MNFLTITPSSLRVCRTGYRLHARIGEKQVWEPRPLRWGPHTLSAAYFSSINRFTSENFPAEIW